MLFEQKTVADHPNLGGPCTVVNSIDNSSEPFLYRGEDCMDVFVKKMIEIKKKIMDKMKENKDIIMRADDWRDFKQQQNVLYAVKTSKREIRKFVTTATLRVSIGDVPTTIVIYSFQ